MLLCDQAIEADGAAAGPGPDFTPMLDRAVVQVRAGAYSVS